ncbi:MAG: putative Ig domain-containing protein, partial [Zoogloeaceae bacterium]|nr:putative Ig domain-containing protein [Zoogloeaceae bacterium]
MNKFDTKICNSGQGNGVSRSRLAAALRRAFGEMRPSGSGQENSRPDIRFEAIEPRVLLSGEANPVALSVEGEISTPGETDQYEFVVEETRRVVLDSLTNRSDLNWKLEGPSGQVDSRDFYYTDYGNHYSSPSFYELSKGTYRLTVNGQGAATGSYALRVLDADAAISLNLGEEVEGTLERGNESRVYRFTATAGERFYFDAGVVSGGSVNWRLVDPYGRQEGASSGYSLSSDRDTFSLQRTGEYLLLVEGYVSNTAPVNYRFTLSPVADNIGTLALDTRAEAVIEQPGQVAKFNFHLPEATPVLFDSVGGTDFYWYLDGPQGSVISRISGASTGVENGQGWLLLPAGDYTLSIDPEAVGGTGSWPFRLMSGASAQALELGGTVEGTLEAARGSALYRLELSEGDKIHIEGRSLSGGALNWRLVNPYGIQAASSALMSPIDPLTVDASGEYWLVLEGASYNAIGATVGYALAVNRVPDVAQVLSVGDLVSGEVGIAGQSTVYTFELAAATQLAFDARTNRSDLVWSLAGPRGVEVTKRRFDQSDASGGFSVLTLPAGSYRLTVRGAGNATGAYAFSLADLVATASELRLDTVLSGTLLSGNSTQVWRFEAAAGDRVAFQSQGVTGGAATWRLIDHFGRDVAGSNNLAANRAALTLATGGIYTLLIEGRVNVTEAIAFDVQLNAAGHETQAELPTGDALPLGAVVSGSLSSAEKKIWRFTLDSDAQLVMDNQNPNYSYAHWSLLGPRGLEVDRRYLYSSDASYAYPALALPAGEYALTVEGGAYAFRLLDALVFPELALDTRVTAERSPNNATLGYRFEAEAGETLILNWSDSWTTSIWTLVDPYGRKVSTVSGEATGTTWNLSASGVYTLLNESQSPSTGSNIVTFTLARQTRAVRPLVFNERIGGALAGQQDLAEYTFTLEEASTVVFDALNTWSGKDGLQWMLKGMQGTVFSWRDMGSSDMASYVLAPGDYTLVLRNMRDTAATYEFRVLNRDAAERLFPGNVVDVKFPAGESRLYRFEANAGESFYFDGQAGDGHWRLLDPYGRSVGSGYVNLDAVNLGLSVSGEYLLVLFDAIHYSQPTVSAEARFNLIPRFSKAMALAVGEEVRGAIEQMGESVNYSFTLAAPTRILVDSEVISGLEWSLSGPRGSEVSRNGFGDPRFLDLPAGQYELAVVPNGPYTGAFHFKVIDADAIPVLEMDVETELGRSPEDYFNAFCRVELTETPLLLDAVGDENSAVTWRLYDERGRQRASGSTNSDTLLSGLPAGAYYWAPAGVAGEASWQMALRRVSYKDAALEFSTLVTDALERPAQENRYTFEIVTPTTLLFEGLTASSDLMWELSGPNGIIRSATMFDANSALIHLEGAGAYVLRVFSKSHSRADFRFRLFDMGGVPVGALAGSQSVTLDSDQRTRIFAFDGKIQEVFVYRFGDLSETAAVRRYLFDAHGKLLHSGGADSDGAYILGGTGRYYLVVQADMGAAPGTIGLDFAAQLEPLVQAYELIPGATHRGSLDTGLSEDVWNFTLTTDSAIVFNGPTDLFPWTLTDDEGRIFSRSEWQNGVPVLWDLKAGNYRLVIKSANRSQYAIFGEYAFYVTGIQPPDFLEEGVATQGVLQAPANVDIYHLSADSGENWRVGVNGARVTVFDPHGNVVGLALGSDVLFHTGALSGDYRVVVDAGSVRTENVNYTVTAGLLEERGSVVMDGMASGTLASPYECHYYRFDLETARYLQIFAQGEMDKGMRWRVEPLGTPIDAEYGWREFNEEMFFYLNHDWFEAGEYVLTVIGGEPGGRYQIQVLDMATAVTLDAEGVVGQLARDENVMAFAFDVGAEECFTIDFETADPSALGWKLYREYRYSDGYCDYSECQESYPGVTEKTERLEPGRYVLTLYGIGMREDPIDYRIQARPVMPTAFQLEEVVNGAFPVDAFGWMEEDELEYSFTLSGATRVWFDALQTANEFYYEILNPSGDGIAYGHVWNDLDEYEYQEWEEESVLLAAGTYRLRLFPSNRSQMSGQTDAPFAFRLLDLSQTVAGSLEYGVPVEGTLNPGSGVAVWEFVAQAGDEISIIPENLSGVARWYLVEPNGKLLDSGDGGASSGIGLMASGRHTLLIDGRTENAEALDYQIMVRLDEQVDRRPEGNALALGTEQAVRVEERATWRFTMASAGWILISGSTENDTEVTWLLENVLYDIASGSFRDEAAGAPIWLDAGEYALTLDNDAWYYDNDVASEVVFCVEGVADASLVAPGETARAGDARLFRLHLAEGEKVVLHPSADTEWRILGPGEDSDYIYGGPEYAFLYVAPVAGDYMLALASDDSDEPGNAALDVSRSEDRLFSATWDAPLAGMVDGASDFYAFTLDAPGQILLDAMRIEGDGIYWELSRNGRQVAVGTFWDAASDNPVLNLVAGDYVLKFNTVELQYRSDYYRTGCHELPKSRYAFRLHDLAQAPLIGADGEVVARGVPGLASVFRFDAQAGDSLVYTPPDELNADGTWQVYDPSGGLLSDGPFRIDESSVLHDLPVSGTYMFIWDTENYGDEDILEHRFFARILPPSQAVPIVVGQEMNGVLGDDETLRFQFGTPGATQWFLDVIEGESIRWKVLDANGVCVAASSDACFLNLAVAGVYTLVFEGGAAGERIRARLLDIASARDLNAVGAAQGNAEAGGAVIFRHDALRGETLFFGLAADSGFDGHYRLLDANGHQVGYQVGHDGSQSTNVSSSGTYYLVLENDGPSVAYDVIFNIQKEEIKPITPGTIQSDYLAGNSGVCRYRFEATEDGLIWLDVQTALSGAYWSIAEEGEREAIAGGAFSSDVATPVHIAAGKTYILSLQSASSGGRFAFRLIDPVLNAIALNTRIDGTLSAKGRQYYSLHLDQPTTLVFDSIVGSGNYYPEWRLQRADGSNVFSQGMRSYDVGIRLSAGDYLLVLNNSNSTAATYAFRVLDDTAAIPVVPGTPVNATLTPANGVQVFTFRAEAGECYYFDMLTYGNSSARWSLIDPDGREVFDSQVYYDQSPGALAVSGIYTLVLQGYYGDTQSQSKVSFNIAKIPDQASEALDPLESRPGPDLTLNRFEMDSAGPLLTGQTVHLQWVIENRGQIATEAGWNDRILVRNLDTGALIANLAVPYDAAREGNLPVGESRVRSIALQLPQSETAVGRLAFSIVIDADNAIREKNDSETGENNNVAAIEADVALAHADLVVEDLVINPAADYPPGQLVEIDWVTVNRGNRAVDHAWDERVEVFNLSTHAVAFTQTLRDTLIEGVLAVDGQRARHAEFAWPEGLAASGHFAIRVVVDSAGEIVEANAAHTGERNNAAEAVKQVGPDLQVRNLAVETRHIEAGGLVTVSWEDWNLGNSVTGAPFHDRIVVRNVAANLVLLSTSLPYDPLEIVDGQTVGAVGPGESRARSFTFRLPDGLKGTGDISITITTDQNAAGTDVLFETNAEGNAEANNSSSITVTSAALPCADLRIESFNAPSSAIRGESVTLSWVVSNHGQVDASTGWNDQIVFSRNSTLGDGDDIVLGSFRHDGGLAVDDMYTRTETVSLPASVSGYYYLWVVTDTSLEVFEPDTRANNSSAARSINLVEAYADINLTSISAPTYAQSGETILVTWSVRNDGNTPTGIDLWQDKVVFSTDKVWSDDDIVLAGSVVTHTGALLPGRSYTGRATITLPKNLEGEYYLLVRADTGLALGEGIRAANNTRASDMKLVIERYIPADLEVIGITGPSEARPGDTVTVRYTVQNQGNAMDSAWRDRIYIDRGDENGGLHEVATVLNSVPLARGGRLECSASFTLPSGLAEGEYHWVVITDADNSLAEEEGETNNRAVSSGVIRIARTDLRVLEVRGPGRTLSDSRIHVEWTVENRGHAAVGTWMDYVYIVKDGVSQKLAERERTGGLGAGKQYVAGIDIDIPLDFDGEYEILVVSDEARTLGEAEIGNNRRSTGLEVELRPYADLVVTEITAPERIIDDPARLEVSWTVENQGTNVGNATRWVDRVILSTDDVLGNYDDKVIGEFAREGALDVGASYSRSERILLSPGTSARYRLFVVSDAKNEVFEHKSENNNAQAASHPVDVMPIPYADLQVTFVEVEGEAASGKPLRVNWEVVNDGIGLTSAASWEDSVWLSRNPDGSDVLARLGSTQHIGHLAVGNRYARTVEVTLPEGLEGEVYVNVRTGGPYEFIYTHNNTGTSLAVPVSLSASPDLVVKALEMPSFAKEGALITLAWEVENQGEADASGLWVDTVWLAPADNSGPAIRLGSFTYDRGLQPGKSYTRMEEVRLPAKIEGVYRIKVVTNANLGASGNQVYEHGAARENDALVSDALLTVALKDRPDLRVLSLSVPETVTAGTAAGVKYTIINGGSAASSGQWTDRVYLSLDGNLSADDLLVGQFANGSALLPNESYAIETAMIDIPIRYRGDAYLIVVADGGGNVDEYPGEGNNVRAEHFYIDAVPFGDLVTSDVVAPDQGIYGSVIEVRYKVANLGSATTRGEAAALNTWTDTIWLARDKTRPGANKGDILLGSYTHVGNLGVGEDYLGTVNVRIPGNVYSGEYFITVWSDAYNVILEDTLAVNLNPDDPGQVDNNNYKARPIAILGLVPPDLAVKAVSAPGTAEAGGSYTFSYTVQNRGASFEGSWIDSVYLVDAAEEDKVRQSWLLGEYGQTRALGEDESYTVTQTVDFGPSVTGLYLLVKTNPSRHVLEQGYGNNSGGAASIVSAVAADLRVTQVTTVPENFSGEETVVAWTVTNFGGDVWAGTKRWQDAVYISPDPEFITGRATLLGVFEHANVNGLATGESYTASGRVRLPIGADGEYYIYVVTDAYCDQGGSAKGEYQSGRNAGARDFYTNSVFENANYNNRARGELNITYREPDLQIDDVVLSNPTPESGETLTVTWTVTNRGARKTRVSNWNDGIYLSRDDSLDTGDYALNLFGVRIRDEALAPAYLEIGESYTRTATITLPESIEGDFHLIVQADTLVGEDTYRRGSIRNDLAGVSGNASGVVLEFQDEGNNDRVIDLPVTLAPPPDLQVRAVVAPDSVLAGQNLTVTYRVVNEGGGTPSDQSRWNDLVYLSKDRFLDVNADIYLGYSAHTGRLENGGSYENSISVSIPSSLEGEWYVFVVTDPAYAFGSDVYGKVREFGNEQNNSGATPILVETPPPADLVAENVTPITSGVVGESIRIEYTVRNDSSANPAIGRWTDAIYLSADNTWDIGDILLGKVDHRGDLRVGASYSGALEATLPPLKEGNWRVIVRPDIYNEVNEGEIVYTVSGLILPPGEANNRMASGAAFNVTAPEIAVSHPLGITLNPGEVLLYKVSVAAGETLRVSLDGEAEKGSNEIYIRYGDVPTSSVFDASYNNPVAVDQEAMIANTRAGDYYILVRCREGNANAPAILRADLLPLSITRVTPDQGGTGDDEHRWVTLDIHGAQFKAGALVKLSRPGIFEIEPTRWQALDATHIRAVFDLAAAPHGLYDVVVINPDGERVTEVERYLVERGIEADVTIGVGGERTLQPAEGGVYNVSLQSLTNVDTPYVRFDFGVPEMGYSEYLLEGLSLPYIVFGANAGGEPPGVTVDAAGNTLAYGATPTDGTSRGDIAWARLDGVQNTSGYNLAPGYAFDVPASGYAGMSFSLTTYPGLAEWINYDFEGLREKLYLLHPDWKASGLLDGGVQDLDRISQGLTRKFLSEDPDVHLTETEGLAMPFRFNVVVSATPLTRDEFIAEQTAHAQRLRAAILADMEAPILLSVLASDETQWIDGWLGALEAAGLLRPQDEAPPIRENPLIMSLNATLASGVLLSKGGESYRTQADIAAFFSKVQEWYGDTAKYSGDPDAAQAAIDYYEIRETGHGEMVEVPAPAMADPADYDRNAARDTHFIDFTIFAGGRSELEYLRHIGVLDSEFKPVSAQALNLAKYLELVAGENGAEAGVVSMRGPQAITGVDGDNYVPGDTALPYTVSFSNAGKTPVGQLRIVSELDSALDPRSLRLSDLRLGDINVHLPDDKANYQGDFDFTATKGFILRVSAGVDAENGIATWLLQAIDPDTGEVLRDAIQGLLAGNADVEATEAQKRGFVSYTIRASGETLSGTEIFASARVIMDDAPPIDSGEKVAAFLDAGAPETALAVTRLGENAEGEPVFDLSWRASDNLSGVRCVTLYVAEDGGDFAIWQRQLGVETTQMVFTGEAGRRYEFLAVATDNAGNREAASVMNAVLPDDGARQAALERLGVNETLEQSKETPSAPEDRSYADNPLFDEAARLLPGHVAADRASDLESVLAPFTLSGFADGFAASAGDIGAHALVELPDGDILASAGSLRNEVYRYSERGGHSVIPLFTLDSPVIDMAVDARGQLWVLTGAELLQVDPASGEVIERYRGPGDEPLTHALAIHPGTGEIYVSSGNGIEIFVPDDPEPEKSWRHFSNQRVGDLAFGPDGRLWGVKWTGSEIPGALQNPVSEIVSFPMEGRTTGRAELEYRISGIVDSLAFGQAGTGLEGLLFASSNLKQRPATSGAETPHEAAVWMIELGSRRVLQVASGGTRGEAILATARGSVLVGETARIDELALSVAPTVVAVTTPDGALVPLPMNRIGVVFDQGMRLLDREGGVLNPDNFTLTRVGEQGESVITPKAVEWDAENRTAWLDVSGLKAGQYQLEIHQTIESAQGLSLEQSYISVFTALDDLTDRLSLEFTHTRANRATGEVSYDVSITNISADDLAGPLVLILDPGRYFDGGIEGGVLGNGDQADLWLLDLTAAIDDLGGKFAAGVTLAEQTVSVVPSSRFARQAGLSDLVKANLGHGIYAFAPDNAPPWITFDEAAALPGATVGEAWTVELEAVDEGSRLYWQLVEAPAGMTLAAVETVEEDAEGYRHKASLSWTPNANADAVTEILIRVEDGRGGVAYRRLEIPVLGGNRAPVIADPAGGWGEIVLAEGEALSLPLVAADADGDALTLTIRNLPPGAVFDAATGLLTWTPGYGQAGVYENVTIVASDGKRTVRQSFNVVVEQGYPQPILLPVAPQTLREGERFALQLAGSVPGGLTQADGTTVTLEYVAPWLPAGARLNPETGWLEWTPGFDAHGGFTLPVTLVAAWTTPDGESTVTRASREIEFTVLNANGAPEFYPLETWRTLEGQPLRISVFAFDPDNPYFEPRIRLLEGASAYDPQGLDAVAPSVGYRIEGLPEGAAFDEETLEIAWTPGYAQAGTYYVTVTATDDGDGTGAPLESRVVIPIEVLNANRAPQIGDIAHAVVEKGGMLEIPILVNDVEGNPLELTFAGLPAFAAFIRGADRPGEIAGVLRFTPGAGDRGDYAISVIARDDGDGNPNQALTEVRQFLLTVESESEAPVIVAPRQVAAVAGEALSVALLATDLDQDALTWTVEGLPAGAVLTPAVQYGRATLSWTPGAVDVGVYDLVVSVADRGLPPQDAGYENPQNPVPNVTQQVLRVIVREANAAPRLLGLEADGREVADSIDPATPIALQASEGVPFALTLYAQDADVDHLSWKAEGLPAGMTLTPTARGDRLHLSWLPGHFEAEGGNGGTPGLRRITVTASDGAASFTRVLEIAVANVNRAPVLLPLPLQLGYEGETIGFGLKAADADQDAIRYTLAHDEKTPEGVFFDEASGYFEWTPGRAAVDNALEDSHVYAFTFRASDGKDASEQKVELRLFDVNRAPTIEVGNHAVLLGDTIALAVGSGIRVSDPDGAAQTESLTVSFQNLPEGAIYDAASQRLVWSPGPGQLGDHAVTAVVSDGRASVT